MLNEHPTRRQRRYEVSQTLRCQSKSVPAQSLSDRVDQRARIGVWPNADPTDKLPHDRRSHHVVTHHWRERRIEVAWERRKPPLLDL